MKVEITLLFHYDEQATKVVEQAQKENQMTMEEYIEGFIREALLADYQTIEGEKITYNYKIIK